MHADYYQCGWVHVVRCSKEGVHPGKMWTKLFQFRLHPHSLPELKYGQPQPSGHFPLKRLLVHLFILTKSLAKVFRTDYKPWKTLFLQFHIQAWYHRWFSWKGVELLCLCNCHFPSTSQNFQVSLTSQQASLNVRAPVFSCLLPAAFCWNWPS